MEGRFLWAPEGPGEVIFYPSLIDPDDTSRNFEVTGRRPYLYFTRFHPCTPQNQCLDRDLMRVRIEFPAPPPVITTTAVITVTQVKEETTARTVIQPTSILEYFPYVILPTVGLIAVLAILAVRKKAWRSQEKRKGH